MAPILPHVFRITGFDDINLKSQARFDKSTSVLVVVWSLFEVNAQLCVLVPGWVTGTVRVNLLVDCSDTSRSLMLGNNTQSMHLILHATVNPCLRPTFLRLTLWEEVKIALSKVCEPAKATYASNINSIFALLFLSLKGTYFSSRRGCPRVSKFCMGS